MAEARDELTELSVQCRVCGNAISEFERVAFLSTELELIDAAIVERELGAVLYAGRSQAHDDGRAFDALVELDRSNALVRLEKRLDRAVGIRRGAHRIDLVLVDVEFRDLEHQLRIFLAILCRARGEFSLR